MPAEIWSKCPNVEYDATLFYDFMCFVFDIKHNPWSKSIWSPTHINRNTLKQGLFITLVFYCFCMNSFSLLALEVWLGRIEGQYPFLANSQWGSDIWKYELWSIFLNVYSMLSKSEFWQRLGVNTTNQRSTVSSKLMDMDQNPQNSNFDVPLTSA